MRTKGEALVRPRDTEKPLQHRLAAHGVIRTGPINGDKRAFRIKFKGGRQQTNNTLRTRSRGQSKLKGRARFLAASLGTTACATSCVTRANRSEALHRQGAQSDLGRESRGS